MASELVKFIGANRVAPQLQQLGSVNLGQQVDVTAQAYEQVRQNVHQGYEEVRKAMAARTERYQIEAQASGRPGRAAELQGLTQTIVDGLGIYADLEKERNRNDAAIQEALDEEADEQRKAALEAEKLRREEILGRDTYMARTAVQDVMLQLEGRIRTNGREAGINTTRRDLERLIDIDFAHLPPDVRSELRNMFFSTLQQTEQGVTTELFNQQAEERDALDAQRRSTIQLAITSEMTALRNPQMSPQQGFDVIGSIMTKVQQLTPDLDATQRIQLIQPIFQSVVESYGVGENERQQLLRTLNGMAGYYQTMEGYREAGMTMNPQQASMLSQVTAAQFGVPQLADTFLNDGQMLNEALQYQQRADALQRLYFDQANQALAAEQPEYLASASTRVAWNWFNEASPGDAVRRAYVEQHPEQATEVERMAAATVTRWQGYRTEYQNLMREITEQTQYQQRVSVRRDPSQLGSTTSYLDTASGRYRRTPIVDENGVLFIAPTATEAELQASIDRIRVVQGQIQELSARASREGFNVSNPGDTQFIQQFDSRIQAIEQAAENVPAFRQMVGQPPNAAAGNTNQSAFPNFSTGGTQAAATPPVNSFARVDGVLIPVAAYRAREVVMTSEYGNRVHPVRGGTAFHAGLDIAPYHSAAPMGALTMRGGEVINSFNWGGYGNTVMVRTPDGHVEQYSHLRSRNVRVGQVIPPGAVVGVIGGARGMPGAGTSTGLHLHFQVWRAGTQDFGNPRNDTLDPMDYLRGIQQVSPQSRTGTQLGAPPTQIPALAGNPLPAPAALPAWGNQNWLANFLGSGHPYLANTRTNAAVPVEQVATPSQPLPNVQAPINRRSYGFGDPNRPIRNSRTANYGYQTIARDPEFAAALAELGDHLNIPAQFLADVMAFESTTNFNPQLENRLGAIGLIQLMPVNFGGLNVTRDAIRRMSRADYVRRVARPYLDEFRGRIQTIEDLLAAIFGGRRMFDLPAHRRTYGDGDITFPNYVRRLGNAAGRRYRTTFDGASSSTTPVHSTAQAGCATCQAQMQRFRVVSPHEAPA